MRIALKPEYGSTLGALLAPRWRRLGRGGRALALLLAAALLAGAVAAVSTLLPTRFSSHGGGVGFGFSYRGLHRTRPDPGGYVKVVRRSGGSLEDSYAVLPLDLPPYGGSVSGALPLAAARQASALERRLAGFRMEGEGKARISSTLSGYGLSYRAVVEGRTMYGRDVMLLPERAGARHGVIVEMLSSEPATVAKPVASSGVLERPLKTFSFR